MLSGMIPFSPDEFQFRQTTITTTTTQQLLLPNDPSRRYCKISTIGLTTATNPTFCFGQGPGANIGIPGSTTVPLELTWLTHYSLLCLDIWEQGYNANTKFSIIEILYVPSKRKGAYDATRKPESLTTKIQRLGKRLWSASEQSSY